MEMILRLRLCLSQWARFAVVTQRLLLRKALCVLSLGVMLPYTSNAQVSAQAKGERDFHRFSQAEVLGNALFSPHPEYPYEARKKRITGSGIALMKIDLKTGLVVRVVMYVSTGETILDQATRDALSQWRFKPGTLSAVRIPITYSMNGVGAQRVTYVVKERSMDDALARYLGKGTVLKGPVPEFPAWETWTFKEGRGVYELHVGNSGAVESVKILKSSGDEGFDRSATKTLGKWRLSRGPLVLELPLRFLLTPERYSVDIAR